MDKHFSLEIVTPVKTLNFEKAQYLRAPSEGLFGVMYGHAPSIINLDIGEVKVLSNNNEQVSVVADLDIKDENNSAGEHSTEKTLEILNQEKEGEPSPKSEEE